MKSQLLQQYLRLQRKSMTRNKLGGGLSGLVKNRTIMNQSRAHQYKPYQVGFTLIEVMLVILIMALIAATVRLSVGGLEQKRLLQARENLKDNLALIRIQSLDQNRTLGLVIQPQTALQAGGYQVVELPSTTNINMTGNNISNMANNTSSTPRSYATLSATSDPDATPEWITAPDFKTQKLPENTTIAVIPLKTPSAQRFTSGTKNNHPPPLVIWYSNGEATPVKLQLQLHNADGTTPIGDAVYVTSTGIVADNEQGDIDDAMLTIPKVNQ